MYQLCNHCGMKPSLEFLAANDPFCQSCRIKDREVDEKRTVARLVSSVLFRAPKKHGVRAKMA